MLRIQCRTGGNYWISLKGNRLHHGKTLVTADRAQLQFIGAMAHVGRRRSPDLPKLTVVQRGRLTALRHPRSGNSKSVAEMLI